MLDQKISLIEFYKELNRPVIMDGAIGSLLQEKGVKLDEHLWTSIANITNPDLVTLIHRDYIEAGAELITTNTFRTNPLAVQYSSINKSVEDIVSLSVQLALRGREDKNILIAGSNAPAEDCYQRERTVRLDKIEYNHKKHIELLWENGCDIILNETQSHLDEIEIICKFCSKNNLPFILSIFFMEDLNILSGEPVQEIIQLIQDYNPAAISFNCSTPIIFSRAKDIILKDYPWGFYLNCGSGNFEEKIISCNFYPKDYLEIVKEYINLKPLFIGACCGSNPNHIKTIKDYLNEVY